MPKLNISRQHREGLSKLLVLRSDLFDQFVAKLETQHADLNLTERLALAITVPEVSQADLDQIVPALIALYNIRWSRDTRLDPFVKDVSKAIESFNPIGGSEESKLRLRRILSIEPLVTRARATSDPLIYDDRSIVWIASNSEELYKRYPDQWILVEGDCVIASSVNPVELEDIAQKQKIKTAFITRVAPTSKPLRMVYAGQII